MSYCILDTRGLLLHSYHGSLHKSLKTEDGRPTAAWGDALSTFLELHLMPLLETYAPRQILACFDAGNTYRRMLYAGYKARRAKRDKDSDPTASVEIDLLMKEAKALLAYLGVRVVHVPGEEADDLIALLCERLESPSLLVVTRDEDILQLVDHRTAVLLDKSIYQPGSLHKNIPVELTCLKKSIIGDSSDEYVGVIGAGQKFFERLLATYGAEELKKLEAHVLNATPLNGLGCQLLQKLYDQRAEWMLGWKLAKLNPAACYGMYEGRPKRPEWYVRVPNKDRVAAILKGAYLSQYANYLARYMPTERLIVFSQHEELARIVQELPKSPIVSYDFETTDYARHPDLRRADPGYVDMLSSQLTGLSINYGDNLQHTIYVPFDHADTDNFPLEWAKWLIGVLDALPDRPVVQNANFELTVSQVALGIVPKAPYDTAIMASYTDENEESGLKQNSLAWLNYKQVSYKEVTQGRRMCDLSGDEVLSYGCDDSLVTSHLFDIKRIIMQLEGSWDFYKSYEVDPLLDDTAIFIQGTDVDLEAMGTLHDQARASISTALDTLHRTLSESCNITATEGAVREAATTLLNEWWVVPQIKLAPASDEVREEEWKRLWNKAWSGCYYTPPSQEVIGKIIPSAIQLNKVLACLSDSAPVVSKTTVKGIENWYRELIAVSGNSGVSEELHEFASLLYQARDQIVPGKRTGSAYFQLTERMFEILKANGHLKTISIGDGLNTRSSDQMQMLLYGKMRLPIRRRSKVQMGTFRQKHGLKGAPATGLKAVAAALVMDVTDPADWRYDALLAYRQIALLQQEISLYYNKYPLLCHPSDGRMHPQFKQCGTVTRRPTGTNPNDLQVSKKDGSKIRKTYRAGDYGDGERVYVCADFANQELVLLACESRDPVMLDAFGASPRRDVHSLTSLNYAHILYPRLGVDITTPLEYDEFVGYLHDTSEANKGIHLATKEIRNKYSKQVNFLLAYLGGPSTLAENLLIPLELAQTLMQSTFQVYRRIQPWQAEVIEFAKRTGYSQTAYGNRRHAPKDLWSTDSGLSSRAGRQVVNYVIQGCAADILKQVRQQMHDRKFLEKYRLRAVKPVYDEIAASVPVSCAVDYAEELAEVMAITPPGHQVGMKVDLSIGRTWGSVIEVGAVDRSSILSTLEKVIN